MYGRSITALNARFARRFTQDGDRFFYHHSPYAAPVSISAKDHVFLIDGFYDRSGWFWTLALVAAFLLALLAFLMFGTPNPPPEDALEILTAMAAGIILGALAGWADLWDYPRRALVRRKMETGELRRNSLTNQSYVLPWLALLAWVGLMYRSHFHVYLDSISGFAFTIFCAIFPLLALAIAIQKLRLRNTFPKPQAPRQSPTNLEAMQ